MAAPEPRFLFVYGTLLPGLAPPIIADVVDALRVVGPAATCGKLYHLGSYPGCILDSEGDGVIHGQLLEIPCAEFIERLDWYEDFVASDNAGPLFVRKVCEATLPDMSRERAWIYCYDRDVSHARRIKTGRYHPQPT